MPEPMPEAAPGASVLQEAPDGGGQSGHPVLSAIDGIARLLMPSVERPGPRADTAEAVRLITALTESVAEMDMRGRAERSELRTQLAELQRKLAWRTAAVEALLIGIAGVVVALWLTLGWPQ